MCDPLTIAGIALTGASAVAGQMASSKAASARKDVLAAERIRQGGLDQEAAALNTQSQDRYEGFADKQGEKSKELGDYFASQQAGTDAAAAAGAEAAGALIPQSGSNVTVQNETKERGKARTDTNDLAAKRGELRAFGDVLGGTGRLQARDAARIGQIGGFKKGSSDVTSLELDAASGAGNGIKSIGDLLGGIGSIATGAGLKGSFAGTGLGAGAKTVANSSMAAGRAADLASVPGYAASGGSNGLRNLFGIFG
ncbi:hypothetical protein [Bosea lathyri]|uniref:Uncharacterized protein n=1 Tax=Bosea lathyri TaxID=1036778 RepID=A0A1H6BWE5_9HYPH|nr:hypothetical protein [Bosea lathyri]SEG65024.1 hypothetical protein SAMN04488115_108145 [Bosea lathyri]